MAVFVGILCFFVALFTSADVRAGRFNDDDVVVVVDDDDSHGN